MNYKLAKELKDAGYPQENKDQRLSAVNDNNSDYCFIPTLSELIEACGKELFLAVMKNGCVANEFRGRMYFQGQGKTPEESVAKLWLALNKE